MCGWILPLGRMKPLIAPTRITALISGLVLGFIMPLQKALASALALSPQARSLLVVVVLALVFFVPVILFVVGTQHLSLVTMDIGTKPYWASLGQVAVRGLVWLIGSGMAFALLSALRL
jgi:hypothetical protein